MEVPLKICIKFETIIKQQCASPSSASHQRNRSKHRYLISIFNKVSSTEYVNNLINSDINRRNNYFHSHQENNSVVKFPRCATISSSVLFLGLHNTLHHIANSRDAKQRDNTIMAAQSADIPPPAWLNAALVQKALRNGEDANCVVENITVKLATAPGDNYVSTMYRVKATLRGGQERSLIVKGLPAGEEMVNFTLESGVFEREIAMFTDIVPSMQELLEAAAPGRWPAMSARCLLHGASPSPFIVLEDLGTAGFKMAERRRGLGLRHALLALRSLARFHAAGHALLQRRSALPPHVLENPMERQFSTMHNFIEGGIEAAANACKRWPGCADLGPRLHKYKSKAMDMMKQLHNPNPEIYQVLIHGDYWTNNMMFKYNEDGSLCDHRAVDLQISHQASPALDVLYFLSTSLSEDVSTNYEDLLIREYHHTLDEISTLLGCQAPTLAELHADLRTHGEYLLFGTVAVLPLVKAQPPPDLERLLKGDVEEHGLLFNSPAVSTWMARVLPRARDRGWLPA